MNKVGSAQEGMPVDMSTRGQLVDIVKLPDGIMGQCLLGKDQVTAVFREKSIQICDANTSPEAAAVMHKIALRCRIDIEKIPQNKV